MIYVNSEYRGYYIIVAVLVLMIFIPPFIRLVMPVDLDKSGKSNQNTESLDCNFVKTSGDKYVAIAVNYEYVNSKISKLNFSFLNFTEDTIPVFNKEYNFLNSLKSIDGASVTEPSNILFDFGSFKFDTTFFS